MQSHKPKYEIVFFFIWGGGGLRIDFAMEYRHPLIVFK